MAAQTLPVLKAVWLASDSVVQQAAQGGRCRNGSNTMSGRPRRCRKLLRKNFCAISPAQIDRLLRPLRVQHPKKGISATRPGTLLRHAVPTRSGPPDTARLGSVEADTVAHCDDSTQGD